MADKQKKSRGRIARRWLSRLLLIPALLWLGLRLGLATPAVNYLLKSKIPPSWGIQAECGRVTTDLFGRVTVRDLMVAKGKGDKVRPLANLDYAEWTFSLPDLIRGGTKAGGRVDLAGLKVFVLRDQMGRWNWSGFGGAGPAPTKAKAADGETSGVSRWVRRVVLENATVVFTDETRDFQSTLGRLHANLNLDRYPRLRLAMTARTDQAEKDNVSVSAGWQVGTDKLRLRADLEGLALRRYFNYALPPGGMAFNQGIGDIHLRLRLRDGRPQVRGRARLRNAELTMPGVRQPLTKGESELSFEGDQVVLEGVSAEFLGSRWEAQGKLWNLADPQLHLGVSNAALNMADVPENIYGLSGLVMEGSAALAVTLSGKAAQPKIEGDLRAQTLALHGMPVTGLVAKVESQGRHLVLERVSAEFAGGTIEAGANLHFPHGRDPGSLDGALNLRGVRLNQVTLNGFKVSPFTGSAQASLTVGGTFSRPNLQVEFISPDAAMGKMALGPVRANGALRGNALQVTATVKRDLLVVEGGLSLGRDPEFQDLHLALNGLSLAKLTEAVRQVPKDVSFPGWLRDAAETCGPRCGGDLAFELNADGKVSDPVLALTLNMPQLRFQTPATGIWRMDNPKKDSFLAGVQGRLSVRDGLLSVDSSETLRIYLEGHGHRGLLGIRGDYPLLRKALSRVSEPLQASWTTNLKMFSDLDVVQEAGGPVESRFTVEGWGRDFKPEGWLEVGIRRLRTKRWIRPLDDGRIRLEFNKGKLVIQEFSLSGNYEGRFAMRASGNLELLSGGWPFNGAVGKLTLQSDGDVPAVALFDMPWIERLKVKADQLDLVLQGVDEPRILSGSILLEDGVISVPPIFEESKASKGGAPPLELDLKISLKDNVILDKPAQTQIAGQDTLLGNVLQSIQTGVLEPPMTFKVRHTDRPLHVYGPAKNPQVRGQVDIIRGRMNLLGRDFTINKGQVVFRSGRRADVNATAETVVREYTDAKQVAKPLKVIVEVAPFNELELEEYGLQNIAVNFGDISFRSEPEKSAAAIRSLLVLGVDMSAGDEAGASGSNGANLGGAIRQRGMQVVWQYLVSLLPPSMRSRAKSVFKFDYFRVYPRFRQGLEATPGQVLDDPSDTAKRQVDQTDFLMDAGISLTEKTFLRGQAVLFSETDKAASAIADSNLQRYADTGGSLGFEYYVQGGRTLLATWNFNVDENLEAKPVTSDPWSAHSFYVGVRNTVKHKAYSPALAKERYQKSEAKR